MKRWEERWEKLKIIMEVYKFESDDDVDEEWIIEKEK